jgi:hypothetical protein
VPAPAEAFLFASRRACPGGGRTKLLPRVLPCAANLSSAFGGRKKKEWGDRAALRSYESWPHRRKADGGLLIRLPSGLPRRRQNYAATQRPRPAGRKSFFRLRRKKKKEWGDRAALRSYESWPRRRKADGGQVGSRQSWPRRRKADGGQEPPVGLAPSEAELGSYPEAPPGRPRILFRLRRKYDINSGYLADRLT